MTTSTSSPRPLPPHAPEFGGYTVVARALSEAYREWRPSGFRRQQVHMWWVRRLRNGFPEKHELVLNGRVKHLFRLSEVFSWFEGYIPSTGGKRPENLSQGTDAQTR